MTSEVVLPKRPRAKVWRRQPPAWARIRKCSRKIMLLRVAGTMAAFTREQLAVAAWQKYGGEFAMPGFPQYPDMTRVAAVLYGKRGLVAMRLLEATEQPDQYRISSLGRQVSQESDRPTGELDVCG